MATVVLIPGSFEGAWVYDDVAAQLASDGHTVHALTLSGLGEEPSDRSATANLDDHIAEVVSFVVDNALNDLVICAHSYGGMVLRGVCDALTERVRGAIYIDAFLPDQGESCWMLLNDFLREGFTQLAASDGRQLLPPPGADPRSKPHPVPSLLQASRARADYPSIRHAYIFASAWRGSPFIETYERLSVDPGWETFAVAETHELIRDNPSLLADILHKTIIGWY